MKASVAQDAMQWNLPDGAIARFGKGKINEIQYSPDGKILAVATRIGIWLYDTSTYQEISLLTDHNSSVTNITFNQMVTHLQVLLRITVFFYGI